MRTTLNLSANLLDELMKVTGSRTKTDAIEEAIREFVYRRKIEKLKSLSGKIMLTSNWQELRDMELDEA